MEEAGFQKIQAWKLSKQLAVEVYKAFGSCKDFGFRDQIQRAAVSASNNIAEGHARRSDKSFTYFLLIAKGSVAETQSMLIVAKELNYLSDGTTDRLFSMAEEAAKTISGLIKYLKTQDS